ncbi:MAG TPA: FecR domain-containing protein [Acidimicrobiia bacterium]|nr:FecR domain-containing protein [Acidimicrobiia bacterium]
MGPRRVGIIVLVAALLPLAACSSSATQESATLHILGGTIEVAPEEGDFALATDGQELAAGDTIRTGERGRAEIRWFDGSITRLDRSTTVEIDALYSRDDAVVIEVRQGTGNSYHVVSDLLFASGSRFDVETPTAVAGVQGTEYAVFVDVEGSTTVAVLDQTVTVTALGGEATVDAGLSFSVPAGADEFSTLGVPMAIPEELLESEWLVFNAKGQRVFTEIPLPFGLIFDPDRPVAYVAGEGTAEEGGGVYRVDGAGDAELLLPLFGASGLALGPDGTVYASDDDNLIHAITADGAPTVEVDLNALEFEGGLNPNAIALDAEGSLYIAVNSAGAIIRLQPDRALPGEVIADGLDLPQGLAVGPDGIVYFMDASGTIYRVDPADDDAGVLAALGLEGTQGGLAFGPDGALYAADYLGGRILRVEVPSGESSVCLAGIDTPRGVAFDALERIYVASYEAGQVLRFDGCDV